MKYWIGYLFAALLAVATFALQQFARAHTVLVDMVYPYISRLIQTVLAEFSSQVSFSLWQALLLGGIAIVLALVVLAIIFRWNPIRAGGWLLTVVAFIGFLNVGMFGLNRYAGNLADDIRLTTVGYSDEELQAATNYFRLQAEQLAGQISRDKNGTAQYASFEELANSAGQGFRTLVRKHSYSVFGGSLLPVKKLAGSGYYATRGISGITVGLTGEASVNPLLPDVYLPFAMCQEMAKRMSIVSQRDSGFSAFLACRVNDSAEFRYSGYLMALRYCRDAIALQGLPFGNLSNHLKTDLAACDAFFKNTESDTTQLEVADMLVAWYIQEIYLPDHTEEAQEFDPLDETQVDLSGIVNAKK